MIFRLFLTFILFETLLTSCDGGSKSISGDFSFWHSGLESTGNIGYKSQGIIDTTAYVVDYWNDHQFIIAKTFFYRNAPTDSLGPPVYYIINMEDYRKDPSQLKSFGVEGPFYEDSLMIHLKSKNVSHNKTLKSLIEKE